MKEEKATCKKVAFVVNKLFFYFFRGNKSVSLLSVPVEPAFVYCQINEQCDYKYAENDAHGKQHKVAVSFFGFRPHNVEPFEIGVVHKSHNRATNNRVVVGVLRRELPSERIGINYCGFAVFKVEQIA